MPGSYVTWRATGHPLAVLYHPELMESIQRAAIDGLRQVPRRGLEVGGVLFGLHRGGEVVIERWRPIPCGHEHGPSFELSGKDLEGLAALLAGARKDPELASLRPVGWFRTRTREGVSLSPEDVSLHGQFFPKPWQVVLVVRPHLYEPARAGFFFREADGALKADSSYAEFTIERHRERRLPSGFDPSQPGVRRPVGFDPAEPSPDGDGAPPAGWPPRAVRGGWPEALAWLSRSRAAQATVLGAVLAVFLGIPALDRRPPATIGLRARDLGGQVLVEWNRLAPQLAGAAVSLIVSEGGAARRAALTAEDVRSGALTFERGSSEVEIRLEIARPGGAVLTEFTRLVSLPSVSGDVRTAPGEGRGRAPSEQLARARQAAADAAARVAGLRQAVEEETAGLPGAFGGRTGTDPSAGRPGPPAGRR